jgi:predicted nucleic acid-binding protein
MPVASWLVDTNVLLRLLQPDSPDFPDIRECLARLWAQGAELFYTSQNLAEFWNVCTRPTDKNGFGLSIAETNRRVDLIERWLTYAPDSASTHHEWRRLVVEAEVSGVQVHDARLVACMLAHGIQKLRTLNAADFARYKKIEAVSPKQLLAEAG